MQINTTPAAIYTHEGGKAKHISLEKELRRTLMSCMLWEDGFYESGKLISDRLAELIPKVKPQAVFNMAIEARNKMKLRHAPLLVAINMLKSKEHKPLVSKLLAEIIQRPDELCETLAIYWKDGRKPIAKQLQKGLAKAFVKFNAYQLGKYNRDNAIKLKDVLFLCHAKPKDDIQADIWKKLIAGALDTPDTWEVELSASTDKRVSWSRLLDDKKLGALALLRNLRNMTEARVPDEYIRAALTEMKPDKVLPFRFIAAARYAPRFEPELESSMFKCVENKDKMSGKTLLLIDVSGSMDERLSVKSDMTRLDAACGLALLVRETISNGLILTFSTKLCEIPVRRGFALRDSIVQSQPHGSTELGAALTHINANCEYERIIVITDEQTSNQVPDSKAEKSYMINVASNKNGVGYGKWTHIDGWSEAVVDYIRELEQ